MNVVATRKEYLAPLSEIMEENEPAAWPNEPLSVNDRDAIDSKFVCRVERAFEYFGTGTRCARKLAMLLDQTLERRIHEGLAAARTSNFLVAYIQRKWATSLAMTDDAMACYRTHVSRARRAEPSLRL